MSQLRQARARGHVAVLSPAHRSSYSDPLPPPRAAEGMTCQSHGELPVLSRPCPRCPVKSHPPPPTQCFGTAN